jgi:hypothetical protein
MSESVHTAQLADHTVVLAAFNAIAVAGERASEQGYDCSQRVRLTCYPPVWRVAIMTATSNK